MAGRRRVLHTLRKLAREIHRRSVWQVLAGYLVVGLVAFKAVELVTEVLGLPLWTPAMAFALLAIGLPVVLATAVVQGGLPGLRMVDLVDPNELEGRSPEEVHVVPEAHPLHGTGLLTWRNAILGGVMAAALLVTSVVAYLAMWAFGIGPVGSLAAQGILQPDDVVVVAGFNDLGADGELAGRVRSLMESELRRSTLVEVGGGEPTIVVGGEVEAVDGAVRVYAHVRLPDGTVLAGFGRTAPSMERLPEAVADLALRLRERFGESLRALHADDEGVGATR